MPETEQGAAEDPPIVIIRTEPGRVEGRARSTVYLRYGGEYYRVVVQMRPGCLGGLIAGGADVLAEPLQSPVVSRNTIDSSISVESGSRLLIEGMEFMVEIGGATMNIVRRE